MIRHEYPRGMNANWAKNSGYTTDRRWNHLDSPGHQYPPRQLHDRPNAMGLSWRRHGRSWRSHLAVFRPERQTQLSAQSGRRKGAGFPYWRGLKNRRSGKGHNSFNEMQPLSQDSRLLMVNDFQLLLASSSAPEVAWMKLLDLRNLK